MICNQCPRRCSVQREKTRGVCGCPDEFVLARAALHHWEEPCISGTAGSGTVFFTGCSLGCVYCQNHSISHGNTGKQVSDGQLIDIFNSLIDKGAHNINLVTPTHYAGRIAALLSEWHSPVPVVYNTSGYESVDTLKKLDGLIDVYLADFKYSRADRAKRYSNAEEYPRVVKAALAEMRQQVPNDVFTDNGIMQKGMIVRHLILPGNTNPAREVIDYVADNLDGTYMSLMAQYVPCGDLTDYPEINRRISRREYEKVVNYALDRGLDKLYIQELSSADKKYIPSFDFTGII